MKQLQGDRRCGTLLDGFAGTSSLLEQLMQTGPQHYDNDKRWSTVKNHLNIDELHKDKTEADHRHFVLDENESCHALSGILSGTR
jgi:hypothetical protein